MFQNKQYDFNIGQNMTILTGKVNWSGQLDKRYIIVGEVVLFMNNGGC